MEQIERIRHYEALLDRLTAASARLETALEEYRAVQELADELEAYYTSDEWMQDFAADEAGQIPAELKRGVLSEDAVYDALEENREAAARMLETVAEILRS